MPKAFLPVLILAMPAALPAQVQQLWVSPAASVSQNLGLTKIAIDYHRPAVKGRKIWGGLVPYGEPWRTGGHSESVQWLLQCHEAISRIARRRHPNHHPRSRRAMR